MWFCRTKVFQGYWPTIITISVPIAQLPNVLSLPLRQRLRMFEDSWGSLFWRPQTHLSHPRFTRGLNLSMKYWLFNDAVAHLTKKWVFPKIGGKPPKWMVVFSLIFLGGILPPIFGNHPKKTKKKFQPFGAPSAPCGRPREPEKKNTFWRSGFFPAKASNHWCFEQARPRKRKPFPTNLTLRIRLYVRFGRDGTYIYIPMTWGDRMFPVPSILFFGRETWILRVKVG